MSGSGERRFDITGLQVLASVLATVTGAVAASYLGVAGTIIGAAVMSVASTFGSAIYKHYLGRTAGRLKEVAPVIAAQRAAERMTAGTRTRPDHTRPERTRPDDAAGETAPAPPASPDGGQDGGQDGEPDRGQAGGPGDRQATGRSWARWLRGRPAWLAITMASLGIFVGVVGGITVFEAAAGKPLDAVVWHHKGTGTTVGGLIGGQDAHPSPSTTHRATPHPATSSPSPSTSPTGSASPSPTSSSGSPSPTSSSSPSPTPTTPSPTPTATATKGASS
jgi:hypothetical protein